MQLHLPAEIVAQYQTALQQAGQREIGGVLMGEHIGPDAFRVERITIQFRGGTFAFFLRLVEEIVGPLREFFTQKQNNYRRFNYIGEWHSHHSFALSPSTRDHATMQDLVGDPGLGAKFAALLLVRLSATGSLEASVNVYQPTQPRYRGAVILESAS